jgi:hypothetical protein
VTPVQGDDRFAVVHKAVVLNELDHWLAAEEASLEPAAAK